MRTRSALAAAALLLTACDPNRFASGWVPYWGASAGRATIDNADAASMLSEVSMMWFGTAPDGTVVPLASASSLAATVSSSRAKGLPVIPTIVDSTAPGVMRGIIADPVSRANHVQQIVALVVANRYDGIDIDYEVFAFGEPRTEWAAITPNWVSFVSELGAQLHGKGKLLSVTIPPTWMNGATEVGYTVYAQAAIAASVDRLRLMVYDWSVGSPGPISPVSWVNDVIAYSTARVPVSKLQLGVPTYGRHWATQKVAGEICPDGALYRESVTMKSAPALAAARGRTPTRHSSGEMTFSWTEVKTGPRTKPLTPPVWTPPGTKVATVRLPADPGQLQPALRLAPPSVPVTCTVQHTVYYPDATSVRQRADAAVAADWSGIVMWAFGYETADVYTLLAAVAPQRPNGAPVGVLATPVVTGGAVRITGHAYDPEFDLPVSVRLTIATAPAGTVVLDRTVVANAERAGMPAGLGPFHGIDLLVPLAPGSFSVCATVLLWDGSGGLPVGCQPITVAPA